jgi:hypothetical protein
VSTEFPHQVTCPQCLAGPLVLELVCPECGNPKTPVVAVGATDRYGDHTDPRTEARCELVGGGVGSHNRATAHPRRSS